VMPPKQRNFKTSTLPLEPNLNGVVNVLSAQSGVTNAS